MSTQKLILTLATLAFLAYVCQALPAVLNALPQVRLVVETRTPPANLPTSAAATPAKSGEVNPTSTPYTEQAEVLRVIDGDTIEVKLLANGAIWRVRYIGMDTPERGDYFFEEATQANAQLVEGQTVTMVQDISQTDRYGRLLRYVYLADGTFVNAELVRLGYAVIATYPPDVKYQAMFLELQTSAREQGVGLWATATSQPADLFTPPPPAGEIPAQCTCVLPPDLNCSAFGTHASAQACYDHCWATVNKDVYRLDRDQDRQACESLP